MNRTIGIFGALLLMAAFGCGDKQTPSAPGDVSQEIEPRVELVARARPPIPDLPVPMGFKLIESKSRNAQSGRFRHIDHSYGGKADKFAVKRFYERHMPINRWVLVNHRFTTGVIHMDFEKPTERCNLRIAEGGLFTPIIIKIEVWTSEPVPTREKQQGK